MANRHCVLHGEYTDDFLFPGCPDCRAAEKQADRDREDTERYREQTSRDAEEREEAEREREMAARQREEAREERSSERAAEHTYRVNNPGEYECPYCMMISLKRTAKRCPKCQHDIEVDYWHTVFAKEAEKSRQQEEERKRKEEERKLEEKAHEEWLMSPEGIASKAAAQAADDAPFARSRAGRVKALLSVSLVLLGVLMLFMAQGILASLAFGIGTPIGLVLGKLALVDFEHGNVYHQKGRGLVKAALWIGGILWGLAALGFLLSLARK